MQLLKKTFIAFSFLVFSMACIGVFNPVYAEEKASKEGGGGVEESNPEFGYVNLKPLTLPILTEKGVTQQLTLVISIEVMYDNADDIEALVPRLADGYLVDLYGALSQGEAMMESGVLDIAALKKRLSKVTAGILGEDKFHDVLLQVVHQRAL